MRFSCVKIKMTENPFEVDIFKYTLNQQNIISLFYYLFNYIEFLPNIFFPK